ncbi:TetR/AcrR family transcriptional regulator [Bacillus kwashiorkori]|uniref:TetR/AcrR family transcriptional regulator n=1 Tax=Bacillus kwashiorkori TaxID=1522318 RepID=UPI0007832A48|nr:TetR family transcriptional regulator C-terminal domain-containing protein [Bacillus kwashiorkori]
MPKIVNHDNRRKLIGEAVWRVILKDGMKGATVRNIAKEAGLSLGSLRHYFKSQEELLLFSMELVKERATERIQNIALKNLPPKEMISKMLLEIVPTNETTKAEMEVWLEFVLYFQNKQGVKIDDGVFQGFKKLMDILKQGNFLKKEVNIDLETERLYALVDGLAIHAILQPERMTKERIEHVLALHLDEICKGDCPQQF